MRAILLESNDDLTALLPVIFARAGITLESVRTEQALLAQAALLHPGDFF